MDKSREQFEMWMMSSGKTNFSKIDDIYASSDTFFMWQAWQASRAALVVELPATCCRTLIFELDGTSEVGMEHDEYYEPDELHKAFDDAGVKYK